jgi:CBS domain containing-hemolysin-like protein
MDSELLLKLAAVLVLVGANAFFVAAEFALVSVRRTRIRELVDSGDRLARRVQKAQENLDLAISGTQLGITLASLGLGWIGEPAVAGTIRDTFSGLPAPWASIATHGVATTLAFLLITYLHIVLGELAPKTVALLKPETVSRFVAAPLNAFNALVRPAIWFLNGSAGLFLRLIGMRPADAEEQVHSPEEIQLLLQESRREGAVEQDEEAMIHGVFELTHTVAREVMTPRPDIEAVSADASLDEVVEVAGRTGHSRFPVLEGSLDKIVGVLIVKDLLPWFQKDDWTGFRAGDAAREAYYVPDSKPVDDLLAQMRHEKVHLAVVVDEFGGTDGIVTLEDLLEEIVGDIYDEHDPARQPDIAVKPGGRVEVDGGMSLSDLIEEFGLSAAEDEYDTVAGYVIGVLGRIPEKGERVRLGEAELEVRDVADRRVTLLELHHPAAEQAGEDPAESASTDTADRELNGRKRPA